MTKLATVYHSTTGNRFHGIPDCPAYAMGRAIWDTDDPPVGWPTSPVFVERTVAMAMGSGKLPCTRCLPGLLAAWFRSSCEEDFGHEPMTVNVGMCGGCDTCGDYYETDVCARCHVEWPCMSAIVLGLVPRTERS